MNHVELVRWLCCVIITVSKWHSSFCMISTHNSTHRLECLVTKATHFLSTVPFEEEIFTEVHFWIHKSLLLFESRMNRVQSWFWRSFTFDYGLFPWNSDIGQWPIGNKFWKVPSKRLEKQEEDRINFQPYEINRQNGVLCANECEWCVCVCIRVKML